MGGIGPSLPAHWNRRGLRALCGGELPRKPLAVLTHEHALPEDLRPERPPLARRSFGLGLTNYAFLRIKGECRLTPQSSLSHPSAMILGATEQDNFALLWPKLRPINLGYPFGN
jgi:hypothetical protein